MILPLCILFVELVTMQKTAPALLSKMQAQIQYFAKK
jgi:hypothetical protein